MRTAQIGRDLRLQKFMTGQPGARASSIDINCVSYSSANGISLRLSEAE